MEVPPFVRSANQPVAIAIFARDVLIAAHRRRNMRRGGSVCVLLAGQIGLVVVLQVQVMREALSIRSNVIERSACFT